MSTDKEAPPSVTGSTATGGTNAPRTDTAERTIRASIKKFSTLTQTLSSQLHTIRGMNWRMSVMPKTQPATEKDKESKKGLGFFVQCCPENPYSDNWSCKADAEMRMVSMKAGVPHFIRKANNHVYTPKETDWGFTCFMAWADILDESRGYIKDDEVVVEVTIRPDFPKNTMTRQEFLALIDKWYTLAEIQVSKGKTDLAIEANGQALKFCKTKDEETKKKLELQKEDLMKRKVLDRIIRIETGDLPTKILKPRFLRQPVTKNVSKVAAVKNPVKRTPKPTPKSPVKMESKVSEEPKKVANEQPIVEQTPPILQQTPPVLQPTPPVLPQTPPILHPTPAVVPQTPPPSENCKSLEPEEVAPEDMSLPGSDVSDHASDISNDDLPSGCSIENDEVFLPESGPMNEEQMAKVVRDLGTGTGVSAADLRGYLREGSSKVVTAGGSPALPDDSNDYVELYDNDQKPVEVGNSTQASDSDKNQEDLNEFGAKIEMVPTIQTAVIDRCQRIIANLQDFARHMYGSFDDKKEAWKTRQAVPSCGPGCDLPNATSSCKEEIIRNNKIMLHLAQQFIVCGEMSLQSMENMEGHWKILNVLAELEAREEYAEQLKMKLAHEKTLRSEMKDAVAEEKAKIRAVCEATVNEEHELQNVEKELGKLDRMDDSLEKKNVELAREVEELKSKLKLAEQQANEFKKATAAADAKAKKDTNKDAAHIRQLKTDRSEAQKLKDLERKNWEWEMKGLQAREATRKEEQKALAAAIAAAEGRARTAEVAQVRLKADSVLSNLEMTRRKVQAGMDFANEIRWLARTEADRVMAERNFKEWCRTLDEVKSLLQLTKCDYDIAEGMINTGAKTLAEVDFPERPIPQLPRTISLPKVQEVKSMSVLPPEIRTPRVGVIGEPRTPRTAESVPSQPCTPLNDSDSEPPSSPWTWPSPSALLSTYSSPSASSPSTGTKNDMETPIPEMQGTPRRQVPKSSRF